MVTEFNCVLAYSIWINHIRLNQRLHNIFRYCTGESGESTYFNGIHAVIWTHECVNTMVYACVWNEICAHYLDETGHVKMSKAIHCPP